MTTLKPRRWEWALLAVILLSTVGGGYFWAKKATPKGSVLIRYSDGAVDLVKPEVEFKDIVFYSFLALTWGGGILWLGYRIVSSLFMAGRRTAGYKASTPQVEEPSLTYSCAFHRDRNEFKEDCRDCSQNRASKFSRV